MMGMVYTSLGPSYCATNATDDPSWEIIAIDSLPVLEVSRWATPP